MDSAGILSSSAAALSYFVPAKTCRPVELGERVCSSHTFSELSLDSSCDQIFSIRTGLRLLPSSLREVSERH